MDRIRARFDGRVFVLEDSVDLPVGALCEVEAAAPTKARPIKVSEVARRFPEVEGLPEDFAAQSDHYLHGTPKRP